MDTPDIPGKPDASDACPMKTPSLAGDAFFNDCFSLEFTQHRDHRVWSEIDGLKEIPELVKKDRLEQAWSLLDASGEAFNDFDFIYVWKAVIFQKNNQVDAAKKTLTAGLMHARKKFVLCDRFGLLEYETGDIHAAVKWWIKSIVAMVRINAVTMWEPFLYLAYVARACGSEKYFNVLMNRVAEISVRGELSLEDTAAKTLHEKASTLPVPPVLAAIEHLCENLIKTLETEKPSPAVEKFLPAPDSGIKKESPLPLERKKKPWPVLLAITGLIMACLLTFFFFSKPPEPAPDISEPSDTPEIKAPSPLPESQAELKTTQKAPSGEIKNDTPSEATPEAVPEAVPESLPSPVRHKEKPSYLKTKTKSPRIVIKKKPGQPD